MKTKLIFNFKKIYFITLIIASNLFGNLSFADPTGLVSKMMKTEISIFSYGLDKLESRVENAMGTGWIGGATYEWDSNSIQIFFTAIDSECSTYEKCIEILKKKDLVSFGGWCISRPNGDACGLRDYATSSFIPRGYSVKNFYDGKSSEDSIKEIKHLIYVQGYIHRNGRTYTCTRKYINKNMTCGVE